MDEGAPELTHALDAYLAAAAEAGAPPPGDPLTDEELRRLDADLAPQKLPSDLRVAWTRFQVAMLLPFPRLIPARLAMEMRSEVEAGHGPAALLPVGYESQVELCVDLTGPAGAASALWEVDVVDGTAHRKYRSMAAYFAAAAEAVRAGILRWQDGYAETDDRAWTDLVDRWNGRADADDGLGVDEVDLNRPLLWPARWQHVGGLDPEQARPRGSTHEIRTLLSSRPTGPATVAGRIVGLAGSAEASRITLEDATGHMVLWVPGETDPFWQAVMGAEVEVDVVLLPTAGSGEAWDVNMASRQWAIQRAALGHDLSGAQRLAQELMRMLDPSTCDGVSVAVRPTRWPIPLA